MSEKDDLLASVADTIKTYRTDELAQPTPAHVERWLSQFTPANQLPFLKEFDHVFKQTFITKNKVEEFLQGLATNEKLAGVNPAAYWQSANFLNIQRNGYSQKEMRKLFGKCLSDEYSFELDNCGRPDGDYIYLDDVLFSGNRVGNDLEHWIVEHAPQAAKVHVIVVAIHTLGHYLTERKLKEVIKKSGKKIRVIYWRALSIENRKKQRNSSGVLWPAAIPDVAEVQAYMDRPSKFPFEPRQAGSAVVAPFSSEQGRQVIEQEFLIAGVKIRSRTQNLDDVWRPLGYSSFGVGFGSMIATYRNCPNNCPLALWWGDPEATSGALHWYPLLQRKPYAENIFNGFDDDFDDFTT